MSADDLGDRLAIQELMSRFAIGIDACDWVMYRSVFTDNIHLDYSSWRAESIGPRSADDWVARAARLFPGLTATRHALTNLLVTFDVSGAGARVRANVCADHVLADGASTDVFTLNGHYDDHCTRTEHGWKIDRKRLVVEWTAGDRELLTRGSHRVATQAPDLRQAGPWTSA